MTTKHLAQGLAGLGRNGDSTLVHMQPEEVVGLQALAKAQGTSLTINPETGLPEAFSLGGFFKSLLPTIAGFAAAGMSGGAMSPMLAGILAGAGTGALTNKDPLSGALMGGLGGYGGANLFSAAKGFTPAAGATTAKSAGIDQTLNKVASSVGTTADQALLDPLVSQQISMYTPAGGTAQTAALGGAEATYGALTAPTAQTAIPGAYAPNYNAIAGATQGTGGYTPPSVFASDASALKTAAGNVAADPLGFAMQNKMGVGMPLGMAALSGLEPSDLYGEPMKPDNRGAYDPYSKLNLSGDTGLRLYATGGPVSFADGGPSDKLSMTDPVNLPGGGTGAMQGSGLLPIDVADINAKYGYDPAAKPAPINMFGMTAPRVSVEVPKLGLFASNEAIESARNAYEQQLAAAMGGRGGMGSTPNAKQVAESKNNQAQNQSGTTTVTRYAGSDSGMGSTAPTASTAETALSRLNLNRQYAAGGTISSGGIRDLYGSPDDQTNGVVLSRDGYGLGRLQAMADGGIAGYKAGGYLDGPGTGLSDSIPATIEGKQPARLADGEFVVSSDVVSALGEGSSKAGAKRLYAMMDRVRQKAHGKKKQINKVPETILPA